MKDYRAFKRYTIDQWEEDVEWLAARLDFIWCMRDYYPEGYMDMGLNKEKADFYSINNTQIGALAQKLHYSVDGALYDNTVGKESLEKQYRKYKELIIMRDGDLRNFLKKSNCNLYEYLLGKDADGEFY